MEQKLNELHFSVADFDKFYIHYLKRQNMLMEAYFKKITKNNVDIIAFQDIEVTNRFSIRIVKKIYNLNGHIEYSPFIIVFKYSEPELSEKAIEDMYAFSSLLSVLGGGIFKIDNFKALNSGKEVKLSFSPEEKSMDAPERPRLILNNSNIDFAEVLKLWYNNYRHRAYANLVDTYITSAMKNDIIRRHISGFVELTNALDTIARNKLSYLRKIDEYNVRLKEIISDIGNENYSQWLTNYAEIRELRFDSKLNILFDTLKDIFVFPDETAKNRFIQKIMDTRNYFTRLNGKYPHIEESNIALIKQFFLYIIRMCFLENLKITDSMIKKGFSEDANYSKIFNNLFELIAKQKY